jgi:hypothetical protein
MDELQAANLSIRADFKSFMATSKGKKVAKSSTALASVKDAASAVAASAQDSQLNDIIRLYQIAPLANRKKFYTEAKKLLEVM